MASNRITLTDSFNDWREKFNNVIDSVSSISSSFVIDYDLTTGLVVGVDSGDVRNRTGVDTIPAKSFTFANNTTNYIYVDIDTNTLKSLTETPYINNLDNKIGLYKVVTSSGSVNSIESVLSIANISEYYTKDEVNLLLAPDDFDVSGELSVSNKTKIQIGATIPEALNALHIKSSGNLASGTGGITIESKEPNIKFVDSDSNAPDSMIWVDGGKLKFSIDPESDDTFMDMFSFDFSEVKFDTRVKFNNSHAIINGTGTGNSNQAYLKFENNSGDEIGSVGDRYDTDDNVYLISDLTNVNVVARDSVNIDAQSGKVNLSNSRNDSNIEYTLAAKNTRTISIKYLNSDDNDHWKTTFDPSTETFKIRWNDDDKLILNSDGSIEFAGDVKSNGSSLTNTPTENRLINGSFSFWQRGFSFSSIGITPVYTADQWAAFTNNSGAGRGSVSIINVDDFINGIWCTKGLFGNISTTSTEGKISILQPIENLESLIGKKVTVSFSAKVFQSAIASDILDVRCGFKNNATHTNSGSVGNATLTNTWERFEYTFDFPTTDSASHDNRYGYIEFIFGNTSATTRSFYITNVKLEESPSTTEFKHEDYQIEMSKCRRYYEKTYDPDTHPTAGSYNIEGIIYSMGSRVHTITFMNEKYSDSPIVDLYCAEGRIGKHSKSTGISTMALTLHNQNFTVGVTNENSRNFACIPTGYSANHVTGYHYTVDGSIPITNTIV